MIYFTQQIFAGLILTDEEVLQCTLQNTDLKGGDIKEDRNYREILNEQECLDGCWARSFEYCYYALWVRYHPTPRAKNVVDLIKSC